MFSEVDRELVRNYRDELGLQFVPAEEVYSTECEVFAPCALGAVLNPNTIPQLKCKVIAGGANNQLAATEDAEKLRKREIIYAPDYVVNVGGAMAITGIETLGWSEQEAEKRVVESVREALLRIFELAKAEGITTDSAARRIAVERLSAGA